MESDREGKSLSIFSSIDITKNEEVLKYYLKSANDINPDIKNDIGWCYEYGVGIAKDEKKAYEWYFRAAMENSFCGQNNLGWCFEKGIGVVKDERKAFEWYLESAKGGNSSGQNNLGRCYEIGIGVDKDKKKAFKWYLKSANFGNPSGQYNLGICYRNGTGTSPNERQAIEWLQKSRDNDDKRQDVYEIVPNVDGTLKEIMFKNSLPWIPFNELKNVQKVYAGITVIRYSAEWTYPHNSGVRIRKVRSDQLTGSVDADSLERLLNEKQKTYISSMLWSIKE
ncbi:HCP-like protein [Gigaspora margarita]|uniref:HCP-like protein n=1 Tax=Gigaspora margarita TaxID=4874 RepID=A0A8H4AZI4_GIGMA|nr:HCP-like protein [Gigaspora margarita]